MPSQRIHLGRWWERAQFWTSLTGVVVGCGALWAALDAANATKAASVAAALAAIIGNLGSALAKKAAEQSAANKVEPVHAELAAAHDANAAAIAENRVAIAEVAVAAGVPEVAPIPVPPDDVPPKPTNGGLHND